MSVAIDFVRRLLKDPPSLLNLVLLIFYALLDLYWALYSRSWPLTLLFYLPFCIPLECAFYLQVRRFLRERSAAPNTMFREESDPLEAQRCWERITAEAPSNVLAQMVRGWFLGEGEPGVVGTVGKILPRLRCHRSSGICTDVVCLTFQP